MKKFILLILINFSISFYCNASDINGSTFTNDTTNINEESGVYEKKFLLGILNFFPTDNTTMGGYVITPNLSIAHSLCLSNNFLFELGLYCHIFKYKKPFHLIRPTASLLWYFFGTSLDDFFRPYIQFDFVSVPLGGIDCGLSCDILLNKFFLLNISTRYRTMNFIFNDATGIFLNFSAGLRIE